MEKTALTRTSFLRGAGSMLALTSLSGSPAFAAAMPSMSLPMQDRRADADMRAVLRQLVDMNAPPLTALTPRVARELPSFNNAVQAVLAQQNLPAVERVAHIAHKVIAGPGGPLLLRVYTPAGMGPMPVIVYFHGGGFVIANLDTYDATPRSLANGTGAIVVSVAYRQAPEFPFPAAPEDAIAAYKWIIANAEDIGGDRKRVAVAGESAGGNLAAVVTLKARDEKIQLPTHQLLIYPASSFAMTKLSHSEKMNMATVPLATPALAWFKKYYLSKVGDAENWMASPYLATDHSGLPPATIINAELDPLLDAGRMYADRLKFAGVVATHTVYSGVTHEFFGMGAVVAKAKIAMQEACSALKASFS
jgi:acetyl esterase